MSGPSDFHVVGTLKEWNTVDRLSEIHVPPLIPSGRYDEATPAIAEVLHQGIVGVIFKASTHYAHAEAPDKYRAVVDGFVPQSRRTDPGGTRDASVSSTVG